MSQPTFRFIDFNPRRVVRGKEGARVEVQYPGSEPQWLWMTEENVLENIETFGGHPELQKALACYKTPMAKIDFTQIQTATDILKIPNWEAHFTAMVSQDALGRRWFMGFKRKSSRSRKKRVVWLCKPPLNLDEVTAAHEKYKQLLAATEETQKPDAIRDRT